jgi:hypothetical protein
LDFKLLEAFRKTFEGHPYLHRNSSLGDRIAQRLYEDLVDLGKSKVLASRMNQEEIALNTGNLRVGVKARRGDGTFGERVPGTALLHDKGFAVPRGHVATVEIGVEVKIVAKSMIKQLDRVMRDLLGQVSEFKKRGGKPICIGIVGINWADRYRSFEGDRHYDTLGNSSEPHPVQFAQEAEERLVREVASEFDELLPIRYRATNFEPYPFEWVNQEQTAREYGAVLTRVSRQYDKYFG